MKKALLLVLAMANICVIGISQDISGNIWEDVNGDGSNADAVGLNGIDVTLTDCSGTTLGTVQTDANGDYEFNPGDYTATGTGQYCIEINESDLGGNTWCTTDDALGDSDAPPGSADPFTSNGVPDSPLPITDLDIGVIQLNSIEGEVYEDLNNDGLMAGSDALWQECFTVELIDATTGIAALDCDGNAISSLTTSSGSYSWIDEVPPGDYYVEFSGLCTMDCGGQAYLATSTGTDLGTTNNNDVDESNGAFTSGTFSIESSGAAGEIDMGVFGLGTISGDTWEDFNGDGVQDAGDVGVDVGDVCLWLIDASGNAVDVLDVNGVSLGAPYCISGTSPYTFTDLPPGTYKVEFPTTPSSGGSDYYISQNWAGVGSDPTASGTDNDACFNCTGYGLPDADGCTESVDLESCGELEDIEGAYYQPSNISGRVFKDADGDDCFGGPDLAWDMVPFAVPTITVSIVDDMGNAVVDAFNTTVPAMAVDGSTPGGEYCFENLPPGDYTVNFSDPGAPWVFSNLAANVDPTTTSGCNDADPGSGDTATIMAESGDLTNACGDLSVEVSAGLYKLMTIGGTVFSDNDEDCVLGGSDAGFGDIEVTVEANCSNGLTFGPMTVTTDPTTGEYIIEDLIPPCDCVIVSIDASMFDVSTGPLGNHITCGSVSATNENNAGGVTNNGSDPGPDSETDCVEMICDGSLPDMDGMAQLTIDFGFFFECDNATTPIYTTCEISGMSDGCNPGDFNYICDVENLNNYCGTMPPPPNATGPTPLCSNGGGPHNTSWVSFIAGDDAANFNLDILVTGCFGSSGGGEGLQWGIVEDCDMTEVMCNGQCVDAGVINIPGDAAPGAQDLIPGLQYYFWLDGCNGSICDFEMTLNAGGGTYDYPFVEVSECNGCLASSSPPVHEYDLCTGALQVEFCVDSDSDDYDDLAIEYYWNIDDVIDGQPSNTEPEDANLPITDMNCMLMDFDEATYPPGQYELCMIYVGTCCDNEGPLCMLITIADPTPNDYAPISVCLNDMVNGMYTIPAEDDMGNALDPWFGAIPINPETDEEPDDYDGVIPDFPLLGCETEQSITITDLPIPSGVWQDVVCSTDLEPGGLYENGMYTVGSDTPPNDPQDVPIPTTQTIVTFEDGTSSPLDYQDMGCDSILTVVIDVIEVDGVLNQEPCDQNFGVLLEWENQGPDLTDYFNVTWNWYEGMIDPANEELDGDGIENDIFVYSSGTYILNLCADLPYLDPTDHGGQDFKTCCFEFEIEVTLADPPPPTIVGEISLCEPNTTATYSIDPSYEMSGLVQWSTSAGTFTGQGTSEIEVDWSGTTGGIVFVNVGGLCGSAEHELTVEIFTQPVASIAPAGPVCINDPIDIMFDGVTSATLDYMWNFGTASGSGFTGPGPHTVSWATAGMQPITLITQEGNCPSEEVTIMVEVIAPLESPQVTCSGGSTDELTFCWNDVGADDYIPTIVTQDGSGTINYVPGELCLTVTGLSVNENVTIQVEAVDNSECANVLSNQQLCTVQDCQIPILTVDCTIPDICLTATAGTEDLSACVSADLSGNGTYSGAGVTGTTFDPSDPAVLAGVNVITYDYVTDDGCTNGISFNITVNPLPIAEFTVDSPICVSASSTVEFSGTDLPDGGFAWDTGGANEVNISGSGPHELSFPAAGMYTISLVTTNSGCESIIETVDIIVDEQVEAPVVTCVDQTTSSVEFGWTELPGVTYSVIDIDLASGTSSGSAGSYTVTGLNEGEVVQIEVVAESDNTCPDAITPFMCEAIACPGANIDLGPDRLECFEAASFMLEASSNNPSVDPTAGTLTWSIDTPSGNGVDQNGNVDPTVTGPGVWTVTLAIEQGDCDYSGEMEVEVLGEGTVNLDPDFAICESADALQLNGEVTDVALDNPVATWGGNGVDPNSGMFDPSNAATGLNTITYDVIDDNGCMYSGSMEITVEEEISINTNCIESIDNIAFTWDDDPCADSWNVSATSGGTTINGTQIGNSYLVENLTDGQMVEFTLEMISNCECDWSGTFECTATDCPPVVLDLENHLTEMCVGDGVAPYIIGVVVTGSGGSGSGEWTGNGVSADGTFDPSIGPGTYDLTYTFIEDNCDFDISTTIEVFENPIAVIDLAQPACPELNFGSINVDATGGTGNLMVTMNGNVIATNEDITLDPGSYTILVSDINGCTYEESVTVNPALDQSVEIEGEVNGVFPNPLDFTFNTSVPLDDINSITWSLDSMVICNECDMVTLDSTINNLELCVEIVYNNGCVINACKFVSIIEVTQIYFPNIITPNDDGYNDDWLIGSNAIESIQYVGIYDRWGELILSLKEGDTNDAGNPVLELDANNEVRIWDGSFKDKRVVPGVYVFVMEYTDTKGEDGLIETGDITVIE